MSKSSIFQGTNLCIFFYSQGSRVFLTSIILLTNRLHWLVEKFELVFLQVKVQTLLGGKLDQVLTMILPIKGMGTHHITLDRLPNVYRSVVNPV